jgi:CHAT domain-containing protein
MIINDHLSHLNVDNQHPNYDYDREIRMFYSAQIEANKPRAIQIESIQLIKVPVSLLAVNFEGNKVQTITFQLIKLKAIKISILYGR